MRNSSQWLRWVLGAGLLLVVGALFARGIRLEEYQSYSPVLSTRAKGTLRARSVDGLHFIVDQTPIAASYATSQTHYRDKSGHLWVIGTDPTGLIGRDASGKTGPPKASTLFKMNPETGDRELLRIEPCVNPPHSTRVPRQCVDPSVLTLPDGRMILIFVRTSGRGDPAFSSSDNQFLTALSTPDGGWSPEPGIRLSSSQAADPDLVRLQDGRWRLYYTAGSVPNPVGTGPAPGIRSALSTDGKTFEEEDGVRAFGCSASATLSLRTGGYRMYCHTRDVFQGLRADEDPRAYIVSYLSADGLEFKKEPGVRIGVEPVEGARYIGAEAPSLTIESDGSLTLLFTTVVEPTYPGNQLLLDRELSHIEELNSAAKQRGRRRGRKRSKRER